MIKIKYGNLKLGDDTIIFNMGPALTCPSKRLNLCPIYNESLLVKAKCYAEKAEILYKDKCINYKNQYEDVDISEYLDGRFDDSIIPEAFKGQKKV